MEVITRLSECASSHRSGACRREKLILYFKEDVMAINKNITLVHREDV